MFFFPWQYVNHCILKIEMWKERNGLCNKLNTKVGGNTEMTLKRRELPCLMSGQILLLGHCPPPPYTPTVTIKSTLPTNHQQDCPPPLVALHCTPTPTHLSRQTYTSISTHLHISSYTPTPTPTYLFPYTYTHIPPYTYTPIPPYTSTIIPPHIHTYPHTPTHLFPHTPTPHTYTPIPHTYTHIPPHRPLGQQVSPPAPESLHFPAHTWALCLLPSGQPWHSQSRTCALKLHSHAGCLVAVSASTEGSPDATLDLNSIEQEMIWFKTFLFYYDL